MGHAHSLPQQKHSTTPTYSFSRRELEHYYQTLPYDKEWDTPPSYAKAISQPNFHPVQRHRGELNFSSGKRVKLRHTSQDGSEDMLSTLSKYNTVIVVDDSGSMKAHWEQTRRALAALAERASKYGANGIDIHFLNNKKRGRNMTCSQDVVSLFSLVKPNGLASIGAELDGLLSDYLESLSQCSGHPSTSHLKSPTKPIKFLVITDSAPTDDLIGVIVRTARILDQTHQPLCQLGIELVQIGDYPNARKSFESLDRDLTRKFGIPDMVHTTPSNRYQAFDADLLTKVLLAGIDGRLAS